MSPITTPFQVRLNMMKRITQMIGNAVYTVGIWVILLSVHLGASSAHANLLDPETVVRQQSVPILGTTLSGEGAVMGIVIKLHIELEVRNDDDGLQVYFRNQPGRFSLESQHSVREAILLGSQGAGLNSDSWRVSLTFPYPGVTLYGDSLSAMVGLSVVALAKGDPLPPDHVMTGTITSDGHIGAVGGVPYKINAAYASQFHRVLIPDEYDETDEEWQTPFLLQVSPVGTMSKAYYGLTGRPLHSKQAPRSQLVSHLH